MQKYLRISLIALSIISGIAVCLMQLACVPTHLLSLSIIDPAPIPQTEVAFKEVYSSTGDPTYAYSITTRHPFDSGAAMITRGSSLILPVTVFSLTDVPINIRLVLSNAGSLENYIQVKSTSEYQTLNPGGRTDTNITFTMAEDAPTGSFYLRLKGEIQEPFTERGGETLDLLLRVFEK